MVTVRILTGHSMGGGSTVAHINLLNAFKERGIEGILYGPHDWHLDKCKSGTLNEIRIDSLDPVIVHYLSCPKYPTLMGKFVYSCHETNLSPLSKMDLSTYDKIHYVSDSQRLWHGINNSYEVIPNVLSDLKPRKNKIATGCAGVIGSIDAHKNTGLSIRRALGSGYKVVYLYGVISDKNHYNLDVREWVDKGLAVLKGYCMDKQAMYESVDEIFHSSLRETFNFVKAECELTDTKYNGEVASESGAEYWPKDKIIDKWIEVLEL